MPSTTFPGALWGDVFVSSPGVIACAYDSGDDIFIERFQLVGDELFAVGPSNIFHFDEHILYVRAARNFIGQILVMGQGNESGTLYGKTNDGLSLVPMKTYGTHSCALEGLADRFHYAVQVSETEYYDSVLNQFNLIPVPGTSQGLIQFWDGSPIWSDLARATIAQMYWPHRSSDVFVGEGASDPAHIQVLEAGVQKNVFNGFAARPRSCYDEDSNTFAIVARGSTGVDLHLFRRPMKDLTIVVPIPPDPIPPDPVDPEEPEEPMACTPVVPPQDIIAQSMDSLRRFCQTYEFQGNKPYVNDEIHENGLFIADGLIYFMMSDTGNWAKVLMNPDDKRPWHEKQASADAALYDYMRRRVGDVPASSTPGGNITGDVNVG